VNPNAVAPNSTNNLAVPASNGIAGTLSLGTGAAWPSGVSAQITAVSSGAPAPQDAQRRTLSAAAQVEWEIQFSGSSAAAVLNSGQITFTGLTNPSSLLVELFDATVGGPPALLAYNGSTGAYVETTQIQFALGDTYYLELVSGSGVAARGSAVCNGSGATSATVGPVSAIGIGALTSPPVGGCTGSNNFSTSFSGITAGTVTATVQLAAPAGLPPISTAQFAPPTGFSVGTFTPILYVVVQYSGLVGTTYNNNGASTYVLNSLTPGLANLNFFTALWSAEVSGSSPPPVSTTTFTGWSNNDTAPTSTDIPFTVTFPKTLSIPAYACSPAGSGGCTPNTTSTPISVTAVLELGYF
jgi:hypothetical protein